MGDVVLRELLVARGLLPPAAPAIDFWIASDDDELLPMVMSVSSLLRRLGNRVEYGLRKQALARQLKSAAAAGAERVVVLKKEQLAADGSATIRTMADGGEVTAPLKDWLDQQVERARGNPPS